MARRLVFLFGVLGLLLCVTPSRAQTTEADLPRMNKAAMDAFSRLEVADARAQLEAAVQAARKAGIRGAPLARTLANLGTVCVGGLGDNAAGLAAFTEALREDPTVVVDPLYNAPDIERVFALAKRQAANAGPTSAAQPAAASPGDGAQTATATGSYESTLLHVPAREQLTQTPVPVYVAGGDLGAASMQVFYRGRGMPRAKSADMQRTKDGFAFLIPCSAVFEPSLEYWVVALGANGEHVGYAGTEASPIVVPIVSKRTRPPASLPGQAPPEQCGSNECPPGMPGCGADRGLGESCSTSSDCSEGLACRDDICSVSEGDDARASGPSGGAADRFFVEAGFSLGLAYVGKGMTADAPPPASVTNAAAELPDEEQLPFIESKGWDCTATPTTVTGPDGMPTTVSALDDCKVVVTSPGFVPTYAIHLGAGYRFTPELYGALMSRIQISRGEGTLAGVLVGARAGYVLLDQGASGFRVDALAGVAFGQIQPQPAKDGPYVLSGSAALELGARGLYNFSEQFALVFTPHTFFMFPTFLVDVDLTVGAQYAF